jgi:hypothetical protein
MVLSTATPDHWIFIALALQANGRLNHVRSKDVVGADHILKGPVYDQEAAIRIGPDGLILLR